MNDARLAKEIIRTLEDEGFYAECPCCEESVHLSDCDLFYLDDLSEMGQEIYERYRSELDQRKNELCERRTQDSGGDRSQDLPLCSPVSSLRGKAHRHHSTQIFGSQDHTLFWRLLQPPSHSSLTGRANAGYARVTNRRQSGLVSRQAHCLGRYQTPSAA
jgi:hypothetical protein